MEEIKLNPEELKKAVDFGKLIGSGFYSRVFSYKGRLIKMDQTLYDLLKDNSPPLSQKVIRDHYQYEKKDFNDREQLELLSKKQQFIRPRVPEGIITVKECGNKINGVSPAIIIPQFKGYASITEISKTDYKKILILLRRVLADLRNLADNQIAQEDLLGCRRYGDYNILQKGDDAQLIDMSGPFVKVGKDFTDPEEMYKELARLINKYYYDSGIEPIYSTEDWMDEYKLEEMIIDFEKQTRNKKH